MPPQPISRITPNPSVDFDPAKLSSVPHLAVLPMTVIAIWGTIDGIIAKMLSYIMKSDLGVAIAMFHALKSQDSQRAAVLGAAEKALPSDDYNLLKAVWKVTKASRTRRHEYAHHLWGIPNIPDSLALLDPKNSLNDIVEFEERMDRWREEMQLFKGNDKMAIYYLPSHSGPMPPPTPSEATDYSRVKCFRKKDFEEDLKEAEQSLLWFLDLQRALFGPSHQAKYEARQRLLAAPQIAQALQPHLDKKCGSPPE